jgi:hypothetical protein
LNAGKRLRTTSRYMKLRERKRGGGNNVASGSKVITGLMTLFMKKGLRGNLPETPTRK